MKTNISQFILISGLLLIIGCSTTDRIGGRFSHPVPEETKELTAEIQITCQCATSMGDDIKGITIEQSCGDVYVQSVWRSTCLPYDKKILIKQGESLSVEYVTSSPNQHKIFVSVGDTTYERVNSGTVSLTERIK